MCLICVFSLTSCIHMHTAETWEVESEATCYSSGVRYQICTICHHKFNTTVISADEHSPENVYSAPCTLGGVINYTCKHCGLILRSETFAPNEHGNTRWITDVEAGCTSDGSKRQICTVCKVTIADEIIPAIGHRSSTWVTDFEETCYSDGLAHQVCSKCNVDFNYTTIPATHNFYNGVCKNCGLQDFYFQI